MKRLFQRLTALLLAVLLAASLAGSCFASGVQEVYTDVPPDAWYARAAYNLYSLGYMTGTGPKTFSPRLPMTRAMFVTVLYRISGARWTFHEHLDEYERLFLDTPEEAWYFEAALWAGHSGIVSGTAEGVFSPGKPLTRQDAAVMLDRFIEQRDLPLPECEDCLDSVFSDAAAISPYARAGVHLCWHLGLLEGYPDGGLRPKETLTRAQAAVVLEKLTELLAPGPGPLPGCVCVAWDGQINAFNPSGQALFDAEALGLEPMPYWGWSAVPDGDQVLNVRDEGWLQLDVSGASRAYVQSKTFFASLNRHSGVETMTVSQAQQITLTGEQMEFQLFCTLRPTEEAVAVGQLYPMLTGTGTGEIGLSVESGDRVHVSGMGDGLRLSLNGSRAWNLLNVQITGLPGSFWLRFETAEDGAARLFVEDAAGTPIEGVVITALDGEP